MTQDCMEKFIWYVMAKADGMMNYAELLFLAYGATCGWTK